MSTRFGLVSALAVAAAGGCATPSFRFEELARPRVSVTHRPLNPSPGEDVVLTARTETVKGATVEAITLTLLRPGIEGGVETFACEETAECSHAFPSAGAEGLALYTADLTDSEGHVGASPASYVFRIGRPPSDTPFPLRVPLETEGPLAVPLQPSLLRQGRAFKVLLVRDAATYGDEDGEADLLTDAEAFLNDHLLADPAYRWRDDQLGFYYTTRSGTTTSYDSAQVTRCGQDPWPGEAAPAWLGRFDSVGVLHRSEDEAFRDCAGLGVVRAGAGAKRHFSAHGGEPARIEHELGHALFGLSDEYWESTESRRAPGLPLGPNHDCQCCLGQGGVIVGKECDPFADCAQILLGCVPTACPRLAGDCTFSNVFESEDECTAAAVPINASPGVETEAREGACRPICDGDCPCESAGSNRQVWILDERPPSSDPPLPDVMGDSGDGERHGAACALCMQTTFCELWEAGRGRTPAQVAAACDPEGDR